MNYFPFPAYLYWAVFMYAGEISPAHFPPPPIEGVLLGGRILYRYVRTSLIPTGCFSLTSPPRGRYPSFTAPPQCRPVISDRPGPISGALPMGILLYDRQLYGCRLRDYGLPYSATHKLRCENSRNVSEDAVLPLFISSGRNF